MKQRAPSTSFLLRSLGALSVGAAALQLTGCGSAPSEPTEHVGTSRSALVLTLSNATTYATKSQAMSSTTVSGGTGPYTCAVTSSSSGGATCTMSGTTVQYTAGATAGYFIVANNPSSTYVYLNSIGGIPYLVNNGASASELFIMSASGSTFSFVAKSNGNGVRTNGTISSGNNLVADVAAGSAEQYTRTDCNGTGNAGSYNRWGFYSASGTNRYWQAKGSGASYTINSVSGGNGSACNSTSGTPWEGFTLSRGTDILTISDSATPTHNTGTVTVKVENPISFIPSTASISSAPSTAISGVYAWGGSGTFTGAPAGCSVTTNVSGGGACTVTGSGAVSYTPGASGGTDVLTITDSEGHTGTFSVVVAVPFALSASTSIATKSSAMTSVTASGGTGPYSCSITTNNSSGVSCSVNGAGVVSYTAGANAGYWIKSNNPAGTYLQLVNVAGVPTVENGAAIGTQLFVLAPSGGGFTFKAGANYLRYNGSDYLTADATSAQAVSFTPEDCNGTGQPTVYNRFGFASPSGGSPHWKVNTTPYVSTNGSGNGSACNSASGTPWEAFYLDNGTDTLTVSDSAGHSGTITVTVENPLASWPSPVVVPVSTAVQTSLPTFHVWGGSGLYTGGSAACTVTTNQSGSAGGCTLKGSGWINYTVGATSGTDTLHVVDSEGHTVDIPITVVASTTPVTLTPTQPPISVAPKSTTGLSVSGGSGLTYSLVTNNSGGSINATTGVYVAGSTGGVADLVKIVDGSGNIGYVSVNVGPGLTLSPNPAHAKPSTALSFSVSGGSGTGYTWSMPTNASGATLVSGSYTAGATAGTDQVKVVDSLGNDVTVPVTVSCGADNSQRILYPYDGTMFPLGIAAPLIQWSSTSGVSFAKITLRYPATGTATFTWSEIVDPNGPLASPYNTVPTTLALTTGGRAQIPALVWRTFANAAAAGGGNASISVQMLESSKGTIPDSINIKFANAQLTGSIYYESYDTKLKSASGVSGATLKIAVGSATPTVVAGDTTCRHCHAVSADGTRMVTQMGNSSGGQLYMQTDTYPLPANTESLIASNNDGRLAWPAISPDGSMAFTNSGNSPGAVSAQWNNDPTIRVSTLDSTLYALPAGTALTTSGIPAGTRAMFPAFATDTSAVAFNYNNYDARTLAMMSLSKVGSTWTFTTPTKLFTPALATGAAYTNGGGSAVWPSFMPAGQGGIVVQSQIKYNCAEPGADGAPMLNTSNFTQNIGGRGELWWVNTTGTPLPTRLNKANGVGYLPKGKNAHGLAGTSIPAVSTDPVDRAGGVPTAAQLAAVDTGACITDLRNYAATADDTTLNFKPTVNPQITGGYQWMAFMSRRMYGNVATINPYATDPRQIDETDATKAAAHGYALQPNTKKLWVSAMNTNPTPGSDPSYPAFYLEGQELYAGNSRSYWVLPQCVASSTTLSSANLCNTTADCCQSPAAVCKLDIPVSTNPASAHCVPTSSVMCSADGGACNVDADCCDLAAHGSRCSGNVCTAPATGYPASATATYDFVASCTDAGTHPLWRFLQTTQTINGDSYIDFSVQSASTSAGLATALSAATHTATTTAVAPMFTTGPKTVDQVLNALSPPQPSRAYLRVTATLHASSDLMQTPALTGITPTYDCVFDE